MQVATGGKAGRPGQREALPGPDPVTDADSDPGQMRVLADYVFALVTAVIDDDQIAVAAVPAGLDDLPLVGGDHDRAAGGMHIDAVVHPPVMQDRVEPPPERAGDGAGHRRDETTAVRGHPGCGGRRRRRVIVVQPVTGRIAIEGGRRNIGPVPQLVDRHRTGLDDRIDPGHRLGHRRPAQRRDQQHSDDDRHDVHQIRTQRQAMPHRTARTSMTERRCHIVDSMRSLAIVAHVVGWWRGHIPPPRLSSLPIRGA
ncbi:MAG: hypothetical protein QM695_00200 [Micropruina sp.]